MIGHLRPVAIWDFYNVASTYWQTCRNYINGLVTRHILDPGQVNVFLEQFDRAGALLEMYDVKIGMVSFFQFS